MSAYTTKKEWWVCSICGPATWSRADWCDCGCGFDYKEMSKLVYEPILREQLAQAIEDKRDGDPLTNQQAQAGFLLGLDTALEIVRGQK